MNHDVDADNCAGDVRRAFKLADMFCVPISGFTRWSRIEPDDGMPGIQEFLDRACADTTGGS